jgi:hypothetical protein
MNNGRFCRRGAVSVALVVMLGGAALAAPSRAVHGPAGSATDPAPPPAVQELARSILSHLPATSGGACAQPTLDNLRGAVTAAIDQINPSREVALAALDLARKQASPSATCVLAALDDTSDELDGSGATIDDAGKTRGFVLYMGPLPASQSRVSSNP